MTSTSAPTRPERVDGTPAGTVTIASRIRDWAERTPRRVTMREKRLGIWQEITCADYWDTVQTVGHALLALGVEPGDRVAIQSENRPEWLYTDVAAVAVRATTVGVYPTGPVAEVSHVLSHSGAKVLIAEDQEQVDKALAALPDCPHVERIVYVEPRGIRHRYDHPKLMSWTDFLALGEQHRAGAVAPGPASPGLRSAGSEATGATREGGASSGPGARASGASASSRDAVAERMAAAEPSDIVTLVYTSGTTGPPKGAMLSVANVEFAIDVLVNGGGFTSPPPGPRDLTLSYLPLCHVAERIFTVWFNASSGVTVHFGESIATVQHDLREVQPTILFGVPRIWEKIMAGVQIRLASASLLKRAHARFWLTVAGRIGRRMVASGGQHTFATRLLYGIGWVFFFRSLRERIGMRRVRYAASGAAPIAPEVLTFFMGLGVPMHEVYGMTENSAVATSNRPGRVKVGTVGEPHPGVELRVDEQTGEILTRHGGTFVGYFRDPAATAAVVTSDGWLHTGDIGEWVDGTHIRITDRAKDIIITPGGKNIAPSEIENALKASPFIKEAVVVGDRRPYLTGLIGIELDTVGEWAQRRGITYTTYRDLSNKKAVLELVQSIVDDANSRFASVGQLKYFRMLPKELDHEDGELTATQKVKRSAIASTFTGLIDEMYRRS